MGQLYSANNYYPAWDGGKPKAVSPFIQQPLLTPQTPYYQQSVATTKPVPTPTIPPNTTYLKHPHLPPASLYSPNNITPQPPKKTENPTTQFLTIGGSLLATGIGIILLFSKKGGRTTTHPTTPSEIHPTVSRTNPTGNVPDPIAPAPSTPPTVKPPQPNNTAINKPPPTSTPNPHSSATHPLVADFNTNPTSYKGNNYRDHLLTETEKSINQRRLGVQHTPSYELKKNGNYIRFIQPDNTQLLIPKFDLKINEHNLGSIETIFELPPNTKQLIDSGKKLRIQLEAPAVLDATNTLVTKGRFTLVPH
jgi:hypothetical protein